MSGISRGRPRSRDADVAISRAAWEVLAEGGARTISLEGVARRAGVAVTTVYRRFRGVDDLLLSLQEEVYADVPVADTGSVVTDLAALMSQVAGAWRPSRRRRGLLVALIAAQEDNRQLAQTYARALRARRRATTKIIARGIERGEVRPEIDAELVMETLAGAALQRLVVSRRPFTETEAAAIVDLVVHGLLVN